MCGSKVMRMVAHGVGERIGMELVAVQGEYVMMERGGSGWTIFSARKE
jgi:hypothetical protein